MGVALEPQAARPYAAELEAAMARLRVEGSSPWLYVAAGELLAWNGEWPLALECLKRLDPLGREAADLRERLAAADPSRLIPDVPVTYPGDPGELVASVFLDAVAPAHVGERLGRSVLELLGFAGLCVLGAVLPGSWPWLVWGAVSCAFLVWLVPLGICAREDAWCHPDARSGPITNMRSRLQPRSYGMESIALLTVVGPLTLGFTAGLGWFLVLAAPAGLIGLLVLMSEPLHSIGSGFPFATTPKPREWGAMAIAALIIAAGGILSAFLAFTGLLAFIPFLLCALATWVFTNRTAGLLAHRIHLRVSAELRAEEPLPARNVALVAASEVTAAHDVTPVVV
ncbi:MAG: hypothetical protein CMJ83_14430 [Planctomycetes bacterium]|nr:hypothetical protein [Planctomycetota bacterium]